MKLKKSGHSYFINNKKQFVGTAIPNDTLKNCFEFAFNMAFGKGHHRNHRTGGRLKRTEKDIFKNTLQGKLAECMAYYYLKDKDLICKPLDFEIYGKGRWDDADIICKGKKISIKSAAYYSNLLLLETKDWDKDGTYIPNSKDPNLTAYYHYFILVRIQPNTNCFFIKHTDKALLWNLVNSKNWYYDIAGWCSLATLKCLIENKYILPQHALLNGKIKMDADNYYIQAGNLKAMTCLTEILKAL